MGAQEWTTRPQSDYLHSMLPLFIISGKHASQTVTNGRKKNGSTKAQTTFRANLSEGWFDLFSEPHGDLGTADYAVAADKSSCYAAVKNLDAVSGDQSREPGDDEIWVAPYCTIEVYQKIFAPKIRRETLNRGYLIWTDEAEAKHIAAAPARVLTPEEAEEAERNEEEECRKQG